MRDAAVNRTRLLATASPRRSHCRVRERQAHQKAQDVEQGRHKRHQDKRIRRTGSKEERDAAGARRTESFKKKLEIHSLSFEATPNRCILVAGVAQPHSTPFNPTMSTTRRRRGAGTYTRSTPPRSSSGAVGAPLHDRYSKNPHIQHAH